MAGLKNVVTINNMTLATDKVPEVDTVEENRRLQILRNAKEDEFRTETQAIQKELIQELKLAEDEKKRIIAAQ